MNADEPDIVEIIMRACQEGGLNADVAHMIEDRVRGQYGGLRFRIPKKKKHLTPEERALAFLDGASNMPTEEITKKHKISRATLYRLMKDEEKP